MGVVCIAALVGLYVMLSSSFSAGLLYFTLTPERSWSNGSFIRLADLDGNGVPEIVGCDDNGYVYAWYGNGNRVEGWPLKVQDRVYGVASGDINNDGENEVVFGDSSGVLYVYNSNGGLVWSRSVCGVGESFESEPVIGDINGDGRKDIVMQCSSFSESSVHVISSEGDELPYWPASVEGLIYGPLSVSDVDGDGSPEIIISSDVFGEGSRIYIFRANASALSEEWPQTVAEESFSYSPVAGDVDGDGMEEIVIAGQGNPSRVYVFEINGSLISWGVPANGKSSIPVLEDLDEDGSEEIVVSWSDKSAAVFVWKGNGSLVWSYPIGNLGRAEMYKPLVKEIGCGGDKEIAVPAGDTVYILSADGRFMGNATADFNGFDYSVTSPVAGDVDGDGMEEIVFGRTGGHSGDGETYVYESECQEDTQAPTSRTDYMNNNTWVRYPQTIMLHEEDNLDPDPDTFYCIATSFCVPNESIDDGETISINQEGVMYIVFNSTDESGFYEVFEEVVKTDWSAPGLVIYSPENRTYNTTSVDLRYTSQDNVSGVAAVFYSIYEGESHTLSGNRTLDVSEGQHVLRITVIDNAGNPEEKSIAFECDSLPPVVESSDAAASYFSVQVDVETDEAPRVEVFYGENQTNMTSSSSDAILGVSHSIGITGLQPDSRYYYYVKACDSVGNCNQTGIDEFTTLSCDNDGDGYNSSQCGGKDCDDSRADIHPGSHDICGNGIDEDCSGSDAACSPPPQTGGGGGGGGSYAPPATSQQSSEYASQRWAVISPENPADMKIEKEGLPVYEIRVEVKERADNAELKVKVIDGDFVSERPSGKVYRYFEIKQKNLDGNIEASYIEFYVNRTWIDNNNINISSVALMRYHNGWTALETRILRQESERIYYEAESPGFSYFAITGRENRVPEPKEEAGLCGDGVCGSNENCRSCSGDCGPCPEKQQAEEKKNESGVQPDSITGWSAADVAVYALVTVVLSGAVFLLVYARKRGVIGN